jgi:adenylate cyclase
MVEYADKQYPPIGIRMLMEYFGYGSDEVAIVKEKGLKLGPVLIPTDSQGRMLVNYYGGFQSIKYYSIADILDEMTPPGTFKDKLVLVGGAATGLGDVWLTPFAPTLPGVEKHATVISNILDRDFLRRPPRIVYIELCVIVLVGLLLGFSIPRLKSVVWVVAFTTGVLATILVVNYQIFIRAGVWVNLTYPVVTLVVVSIGVVVYQYFTEEKEKRFIKKAFKQYLNEALVDQLASSPEGLKLGGQQMELSVLFSDIRNFTTISEGLTPEQLVSLINTYLSLMTDVIMEEKGTVDKYIGDAIMAVYGAPLFYENHPAQACKSALRMMDELEKARQKWRERDFPEINIGIGINTGEMVVGNMGSQDRFDYTVMGDSVNLASRLEGLCKTYAAGIIISEFTAARISGFVVRELDLVKVKGKDKPIKIFELLREGEPDADLARELSEYATALEAYRAMRWDEAQAGFERLHGQTGGYLYRAYGERCAAFKASPPETPWDGVYTFSTK